jgi:4'-phosphopantetheinyl transferase
VTTELGPDDVQIWYRQPESMTDAAVNAAAATLSADECARRDRFHFANDRRDYIVAHDLLRRSLSIYAHIIPNRWQFLAGAHGKPFISAPAQILRFNLSRTRGLVACAVTRDMHVGIDVERMDRAVEVDLLAARYFSDSEIAALERAAGNARFFELWTMKEAFIKAVGVGLSQPLNTVSFDLDENEPLIHFAAPTGFNASEWHFALYSPMFDTRLAVAIHTPTRRKIDWHAHDYESGNPVTIRPIRTTG